MTEASFFLSKQPGADPLFSLTRRLAQAAWARRRQTYIHCADESQCQSLDDWLWQQPDDFLPHEISGSSQAPIMLGWQEVPDGCHDLLINLAADIPDFFSRFQQVAEPIGQSENERQQAREHWRYYSARGYKVQKHEI